MHIVDHRQQPLEQWRPGVMTRMLVSGLIGAGQLCLFEQFCEPGRGAPTHSHSVEEVLTIQEGRAEVWVGDERIEFAAGQSVIVPAGARHGFRNIGDSTLHVRAVLASPTFEAEFDDRQETQRRWAGRDQSLDR